MVNWGNQKSGTPSTGLAGGGGKGTMGKLKREEEELIRYEAAKDISRETREKRPAKRRSASGRGE